MDAVLSNRRRLLVAAPVACGCLLASAAVYVASADPLGDGTTLVPCPLFQTTGLWCPGCGLTRAVHAVLHGDVPAAFGYNLLFPLFVGAIVVGWLAWMRAAMGRPASRLGTLVAPMYRPATGVVAVALIVAFGVARNIPALHALAP